MTHEEAMQLLRDPSTWCKGAAEIVRFGKQMGLYPLIRTYTTSLAEGGKGCLVEALKKLDAVTEAPKLLESKEPWDRAMGIDLLYLFPRDEHLALFERVIQLDPEPWIRHRAAAMLIELPRTPAWNALFRRLLDAETPDSRKIAVEGLSQSYAQWAVDALKLRLSKETDPELRVAIETAIRANEEQIQSFQKQREQAPNQK